ncbi:hypothetical protein [Algoriphagus halophytocola]|uniref:Uncharacterized protein n=1 Tax=Algoriphagus halophytocola TaxID=2991499 RepID=A0ABY6MC25_9BACT|nr:hypothetical protein [Algoriphagus sp. TR-M5]UZD21165.1 hypothetical protein OM944_10815 [Algoriphagus sp. TR-M5]
MSKFNQLKGALIESKLDPTTGYLVPDSYVHAWQYSLYPLLSNSAFHNEVDFDLGKTEMEKIFKIFNNHNTSKNYKTFYEYELQYCIDRPTMIRSLKYFKLFGSFNNDFWEKLLISSGRPIEATEILKPLHLW